MAIKNVVKSYIESNGNMIIGISSINENWIASEVYNIKSVRFIPGPKKWGRSPERLIVKAGSTNGPEIIRLESDDGKPRIDHLNSTLKLALDYVESNIHYDSKVIIITGK